MRASLIAVNNSMACGQDGAGRKKQDQTQPQCWALPTGPLGRGLDPEGLPEGGRSQTEKVQSATY